jgi:hypothetical protein
MRYESPGHYSNLSWLLALSFSISLLGLDSRHKIARSFDG